MLPAASMTRRLISRQEPQSLAHADARVRVRQRDELVEPAVGDHHVVGDYGQQIGPRDGQALMAGGGAAPLLGVGDDRHGERRGIADASQIGGSVIG
jgi:hypothetical protein